MDALTQALENLIQQILAIGSFFLVITIAMCFIPYVLFGVGISSVADRYGIGHTWQAWVPIARKHLLAEIADIRRQYKRKKRKLETQFEFISYSTIVCLFFVIQSGSVLAIIALVVLLVLYAYNQYFCYYYFYRLCDEENATAYFILGLLIRPLNSLFVFHCR